MTLYQISEDLRLLLESIENGDIPEDAISDTLEAVQGDFQSKADDIACYIKSLLAAHEAIMNESEKLATRAKQKKGMALRLRDYLLTEMQHVGMDKFETTRCKVSIRNNPPSVNVTDAALLYKLRPDLFTASEPKPSLTAIGSLLKSDIFIPGAELVSKKSITIK